MKTIGILGGMSFESTLHYVEKMNAVVRERLGGWNSVKLELRTVNFAEIVPLLHAGEWEKMGRMLAAEARKIEAAGADFLVIASNTIHKVAPQVAAAVGIPLLHIAEATADALRKDGVKTVGLLGTTYTMEQDFYKDVLKKTGLSVLIPSEKEERDEINRIIFEELCVGVVKPESEAKYQAAIRGLKARGAEGVILGCTEIGMLVKSAEVPLYDTTDIHVWAAAERALES